MKRWLMTRPIANAATSALFAIAVASAGHAAADTTPVMKEVIKAANAEGKLVVSWGQQTLGGAQGAKKVQDGMNRMFGTNIQVVFAPGPSFPAMGFKMLSEVKAGRAASSDVYVGAMAQIALFARRGLFQPSQWASYMPDRISGKMVEADGTSVRLITTISGVTYNTKLAPFTPKYMTDFLKPEWKGKIAVTPYVANLYLLAGSDVWGMDKALDYSRKLSGQVAGIIPCRQPERLSSGEFWALVMDCGGADVPVWKSKGAPLDQMVPADFAKLSYYYLAVPKHAKSPNAARLYASYLLTDEGQRLLWQMWNRDLHTYPGSRVAKRIAALLKQGITFKEFDIAWVRAHPEIFKATKEMINILVKKKK